MLLVIIPLEWGFGGNWLMIKTLYFQDPLLLSYYPKISNPHPYQACHLLCLFYFSAVPSDRSTNGQ